MRCGAQRSNVSCNPVLARRPGQVRCLSLDDVCQLDQHIRFVADNPSVMPRVYDRHVPRPKLHLGTIIHPYSLSSCEKDLHMESLAAFATNDGLDMLRPSPAGLEGFPIKSQSAHRKDINLPFLKRPPTFVGRTEVLTHDGFTLFGHDRPPLLKWVCWTATTHIADLPDSREIVFSCSLSFCFPVNTLFKTLFPGSSRVSSFTTRSLRGEAPGGRPGTPPTRRRTPIRGFGACLGQFSSNIAPDEAFFTCSNRSAIDSDSGLVSAFQRFLRRLLVLCFFLLLGGFAPPEEGPELLEPLEKAHTDTP